MKALLLLLALAAVQGAVLAHDPDSVIAAVGFGWQLALAFCQAIACLEQARA